MERKRLLSGILPLRCAVLGIVLLLVLGFAVPLAAQQNSNSKKLVGVWTDQVSNDVWVFKNDGTILYNKQAGKYGATESMIFINLNTSTLLLQYSISVDGNTLILQSGDRSGSWLTRQS
jgi:putative flippase GtrA